MINKWLYILFLIPAFSSCLESPEMTTGIINGKERPTVITGQTNTFHIDGNLFFEGQITYTGKAEITENGFLWGTNPDSINKVIFCNPKAEIFSHEFKNALGNTIYYWQSFAKNSYGYDYGEVRSYNTPKIWEEKTSLNVTARGESAYFVLNDKIYITCGVYYKNGTIRTWTDDICEYDILNTKWQTRNYFPGGPRSYPVVFTIGNLAYVGTGHIPNVIMYKDFYCFDNALSLYEWTKIDTPDAMLERHHAIAFSIDGKGYLVGGISGSVELDDIWQYNPEIKLWVKKGNFPVKILGGISLCGNDRAFVGFGNTSETARTLWEYNYATDKWIEFAVLPDYVGKIFSGVIVRNTIYILDDNYIIWAYDIGGEHKTWEEKNELPSEAFPPKHIEGEQYMLTTGKSNSIYVGLGFSQYLYEYRPLWDN